MKELFDTPIDSLTLAGLETALGQAGYETAMWEAKGGGTLRTEHVAVPVAGLANRSGGLLVLGAEPKSALAWRLVPLDPVGDEPGVWIGKAIHDSLRPVPNFEINVWPFDHGGWVGVIRVQPTKRHPVVFRTGAVYRREHGQTRPLTDGTRLTELVLELAGPGALPNPSVELDLDDFGRAVRGSVQRGSTAPLRSLLPQLRNRAVRAARFSPEEELEAELDRLAALNGLLLQLAPEDSLTKETLASWHAHFDAGLTLRDGPYRFELNLWRAILARVRAVGALAVRLELWSAVRYLAEHPVPVDAGDRYPGWLTYVGVEEGQALGRPLNAEHYRQPLRDATAVAESVEALHPDAPDEHQLLDAVIEFDFLASLVELDSADRAGRSLDMWPNFAFFDPRGLRRLTRALVDGGPLSRDVTPGLTVARIARLLWLLHQQVKHTMSHHHGIWAWFSDSHTWELMKRFGSETPTT